MGKRCGAAQDAEGLAKAALYPALAAGICVSGRARRVREDGWGIDEKPRILGSVQLADSEFMGAAATQNEE